MAGCANQEPLVSETSGSGTAKTLADAWNARRVVRSDHRKIYDVGFSSATTVLSGVINGHFARLSSFGPKKRRKALWKRSRPRPGEGGLRSCEKISIDSKKGSRFRLGTLALSRTRWVETNTREQVASSSHVSMEEKAAEGNVAYFSEYAAEELESKLVKYRDEDGRTLLHTASAAGASSYAPLRRVFSDPRRETRAHLPPPHLRAQASSTSSSSSSAPMPAEGW